jgi:Asp-tRNA(Asn)/Glu-tRNA(Gln) amidotransferase A subunit family amidase
MVLETEGWPELDRATRAGFEQILNALSEAGIKLLRRADHPLVESLEQVLREARRVAGRITIWENRWAQRNLVNEHPDGVSDRTKASLAMAERMTPSDYRALLEERTLAQAGHRAAAGLADAVITLSGPGPAPIWRGDVPGEAPARSPTGDFVFNAPSSLLFAPAVTLPKLAVGGMPVGVQVVGLPEQDAKITGLARWIDERVDPVRV